MNLWPVIKLSWKNVWRNPVRSGVVIISVILGTWAGVFSSAFMNGLSLQYIKNELENYTAHIQIHHAGYNEENLPSYYIPSADSIIEDLRSKSFVQNVTARSLAQGLASSATNTFGVTVNGVDLETDSTVSSIYSYLVEGDLFDESTRNPVLIGQKLADRLNIKLRSRMVLNFQDVDGNITAAAFRVAGIFNSPNANFDESNVFVPAEDLNQLMDRENLVHEIALLVDDFKQADAYAEQIRQNENLEVRSWGDISPALRYTDSMLDFTLYIFMIIIIIALTFGIVNTMLMAVMERTQELGMLMAIGVNKPRTFSMIMFETLFLTLVGVPAGLFLSWATIAWLGTVGIDLSAFSQGLEMYGISSMVHPELSPAYYGNIALLMLFATLLAAIYPSIKALKLNPVQAIRKL